MAKNRELKQEIAVFGESGSGKTVLISSFYGVAQEPQTIKKSLYNVVAQSPSQGTRLMQNYLGMKKSAVAPEANRFSATAYSFVIKLKDSAKVKGQKAKAFDALRLVWHDYPGEWFEQDASGAEEATRRVDTFRALLHSDVALLLVDAQRLLDNAGEEERYLKSLMSGFRNGLLLLRDDLLVDGEPLVTFPRIWILALSKSDLLPHLDVYDFRDLVVEKVGAEIVELREVVAGLIDSSEALSIGEDFVLLSSAKFSADEIEMTKRIGLDLILPISAVLPFERHVKWAQKEKVAKKVALELMGSAEAVASALGVVGGVAALLTRKKGKVAGKIGFLLSQVGPSLSVAAKEAGAKLKVADAQALAKQNDLMAILEGFRQDLERNEEQHVLLRSLE